MWLRPITQTSAIVRSFWPEGERGSKNNKEKPPADRLFSGNLSFRTTLFFQITQEENCNSPKRSQTWLYGLSFVQEIKIWRQKQQSTWTNYCVLQEKLTVPGKPVWNLGGRRAHAWKVLDTVLLVVQSRNRKFAGINIDVVWIVGDVGKLFSSGNSGAVHR